jgi:hypothetical protein
MKTMTGGKEQEQTAITRLDKELIWTLDNKKKTYTEMTFAEFKKMMEDAEKQMKEHEEDVPDTTTEDMYEWKVETLSAAEPKTIRGWECRNVRMVATGTNKQEPKDWEKIDFDLWNSEQVPGTEEIREFQMKYMKALGLDEWMQNQSLQQAIALYQKQFENLAEEMKKAPGESVESTIEIRRHQLVGPNVGKAITEGMKNEIMGKLPFGKKKEPKQEEPKWEERVKFSVKTELMSSVVAPVDATTFDVPAGFKKKDK